MSEYYNVSGSPSTGATGASATMRNEFSAISAGFDKLPTMSGNGAKIVRVNAGGTALEAATAATILSSLGIGSVATNNVAADINLNNTSLMFDGPILAQGNNGHWVAAGTVTVKTGVGNSVFQAKLWDGTNVVATSQVSVLNNNASVPISLSGNFNQPASNIKISVGSSSVNGKITFNSFGNGVDSTLTAFRVA